MFKCEQCGKLQEARVKSSKKVTETRNKADGKGTEIAKEITVCPSCL
jgi:hypothetical protein